MQIEDIARWFLDRILNSIGVLAVVASLVFVGLELRQNQTIAIAGQVQARNNNIADALIAPLEGQIDSLAH